MSKEQYNKEATKELFEAVQRGNELLSIEAIEKGADVNASDERGCHILSVADNRSVPEIVKLLLDNGADVNAKRDFNAPILASSFSNEVLKVAINHGANLSESKLADRLILLSKAFNYTDTIKTLIENGAKTSLSNEDIATLVDKDVKPHAFAAIWCKNALAEDPVYGEMPTGVNFQLLQKVMKRQLIEEGSIDKLNAFAAADNPIANDIKDGTFIKDTTNAILEKHAVRLYQNILCSKAHDVETLSTLSQDQDMQKIVAKRVKELCATNGIVSYENAKTALNSVNIPYYMREEMRKTLDESRSIFEVIEGGVLGSVYDQTPVPKDLLTKYQDNAHPYDPSTDKRKTLLDLKREEIGPLEAEQLSLLMDNPNLILPKAVKNHLNKLGVKEKAEAYHNYAATIIQKAFRSQDPKKVQRIIRANAAEQRAKLNQSKGPVEETKGEFNILASNEDHSATTIGPASQTPETKKAPEEKSPL